MHWVGACRYAFCWFVTSVLSVVVCLFLHNGKGFLQIIPVLANLISHSLFRPLGKIKVNNFQVFDIHWLYRTSRYAIVNVDIRERNDVTKRHV